MEIPYDRLSPEALQGLIEEFITREGTDYGSREIALETKVAQVRRQLERGETVIVYDEETRTCNLMTKDDLRLKAGAADSPNEDNV